MGGISGLYKSRERAGDIHGFWPGDNKERSYWPVDGNIVCHLAVWPSKRRNDHGDKNYKQ